MGRRDKLEKIFRRNSFDDFKWIDPKGIVISQWVRLKCMFGCPQYGQTACCPPNVPSVQECERLFREYEEAVIFHFERKMQKPEDRHKWSKEINTRLLKVERDVFLAGYPKAFLLFIDTCHMCNKCSGSRVKCSNKTAARPAPEALAVDVFSTVKSVGYPIEVLSDYSQKMNRYAILLTK
jgi:predicted metal-binding protein